MGYFCLLLYYDIIKMNLGFDMHEYHDDMIPSHTNILAPQLKMVSKVVFNLNTLIRSRIISFEIYHPLFVLECPKIPFTFISRFNVPTKTLVVEANKKCNKKRD